MLEIFKFHFQDVFLNFFNFQTSIRAHVGTKAFATLQIELDRVVDYDSKWFTECHKDCMLETMLILFLRRLMIMFFNFQNSIRAHVGHRAFAILQIELYRVVDYDSKWFTECHKDCMLETMLILFLRRLMIMFFNFQNSIRAHVGHRAFAIPQIELYRAVDYDSRWSTKF